MRNNNVAVLGELSDIPDDRPYVGSMVRLRSQWIVPSLPDTTRLRLPYRITLSNSVACRVSRIFFRVAAFVRVREYSIF